MNVAERLGDERAGPIGAAFRRRRVEQRQDALVRVDPVFGLCAAIAGLGKAGHAVFRVANPPFRCGSGRAPKRPANRQRRRAVRRHQHNSRLQARAVLRSPRPRQALKRGPFLERQDNRGSLHQRCCPCNLGITTQRSAIVGTSASRCRERLWLLGVGDASGNPSDRSFGVMAPDQVP